MSEKPEALRLAENLENPWHGLMVSSRLLPGVDPLIVGGLRLDSAIELRRLHADNERLTADNERLREALRGIAKIDFRNVDSIWARLLLREVVDKTKDALRREDV